MRTEKKIIAYNKEMKCLDKLNKEQNILIPFKTKMILFFFVLSLNITTLILYFKSIIPPGHGFLFFALFASFFLVIPFYCHMEEKKRRHKIYFSPEVIIHSLLFVVGITSLNLFVSFASTITYEITFHSAIDLDTIGMITSGIISLISAIVCLIYIKKITGNINNENKKIAINTKREKIKELETSIYNDLDSVDKARLQSLEIKKMNLYYSNLLLIDVLKKRLKDSGYSNYEEYEEDLLSSKVRENNNETINLHNI